MDDDVRRIGAFHDVARPGALLRRARPGKKRAVCAGAMPPPSWGVRGLLSDRAHGVGNRWLDEWSLESSGARPGDRFCRRNSRPHDFGLVRARLVYPSWAPARI